jgi:Bacterial Ig-like domain (group 2)
MMRAKLFILLTVLLQFGCVHGQVAINGNSKVSGQAGINSNAHLHVVSLAISPVSAQQTVGLNAPFSAIATLNNGKLYDVTKLAAWSSSNASIASVGTLSAVQNFLCNAAGTARVSATYGTIPATAQLQCASVAPPPSLVSITVTPTTLSVAVGQTDGMTATGTYSDGSTQNITAAVAHVGGWSSGTPADAVIGTLGATQGVNCIHGGSSLISATLGTITGSSTITCNAVLTAITVTPTSPSVLVGAIPTFIATGTYNDGSSADVTLQATWTSGTPAVASIGTSADPQPVNALSAGTSAISAAVSSISGSSTLTVTAPGPPPPTLSSITVTPANPTINVGSSLGFIATCVFSDSSTQDCTLNLNGTSTSWTSGTPAVATIGSAQDPQPVNGITAGSSVITASVGGKSGTSTLTVQTPTPTLSSIAVTPTNPTQTVGSSVGFTATGTYSDGSSKNLTSTATWTSGTPAVATIGSASNPQTVNVIAAGTSTITATVGAVHGSTTLTGQAVTACAIPVISNVTWTSTANSLTGCWQTNIPATSAIATGFLYAGSFTSVPGNVNAGLVTATTDLTGVTSHCVTYSQLPTSISSGLSPTPLPPASVLGTGVLSQGVSGGSPCGAQFQANSGGGDNDTFNVVTAPAPSGTTKYNVLLDGGQHVQVGTATNCTLSLGGANGCFSLWGIEEVYLTQGTMPSTNALQTVYTISGGTFASLHFCIGFQAGGVGDATVASTNVAGDTVRFYQIDGETIGTTYGNIEYQLMTNCGGTTPSGSYTLTATTTDRSGHGLPAVTVNRSITVDPAPLFAFGVPASIPAIPCLTPSSVQMNGQPCSVASNKIDFTSNLTTYAAYNCRQDRDTSLAEPSPYGSAANIAPPQCNPATTKCISATDTAHLCVISQENCSWYYDGIWNYLNVGTFFSNPSLWNQCVTNAKNLYVPAVIGPGVGNAHRFFPKGIYTDFQNTADANDSTALNDLANGVSTLNQFGATDRVEYLQRETAFALKSQMYDTLIGSTPHFGSPATTVPSLNYTVDHLLGFLDQQSVSQNARYTEFWMNPLIHEALFDYLDDGNNDPRIRPAVKANLDWMWTNYWSVIANDPSAFPYDLFRVNGQIGNYSGKDSFQDLNCLYAPAYWRMFYDTGLSQYQTEGDTLFQWCVLDPNNQTPFNTMGFGNNNGPAGKEFSQMAYWIFQGLGWRTGCPIGVHCYWVSPPFGSDSNPGTQQQPWATLTHALANFTLGFSGAIIHLGPGSYGSSTLSVTQSGSSPSAKLLIQCDAGVSSAYAAIGQCTFGNSFLITGNNIDFVGLDDGGNANSEVAFDGICDNSGPTNCTTANNLHFRNNYLHDMGQNVTGGTHILGCPSAGAILVPNVHGHVVTDPEATGNLIVRYGTVNPACSQGGGIYIDSPNPVVEGNIIGSSAGFNIQLFGETCGAVVSNNDLFKAGQYNIIFDNNEEGPCATPGFSSFVNNTMHQPGLSHVYLGGTDASCTSSTPNLWSNNLWDTTKPFFNSGSNPLSCEVVKNQINEAPTTTFVNYQGDGSGDYTLQTGSAAIGGGTRNCSTGTGAKTPCTPTNDFLGNIRATPPSIGVYEQ